MASVARTSTVKVAGRKRGVRPGDGEAAGERLRRVYREWPTAAISGLAAVLSAVLCERLAGRA